MKKYYVYELYNQMGTIEYVGETTNPLSRWYNHKSINGKFYNRLDIKMHIVKEFDNRRDAWYYQCELQSEYKITTDSEKISNSLKCRTREERSNSQKGKVHSDLTKQKMSCSRIGNKNAKGKFHSKETKEKMSNSQKGRVHSDDTKLKISESIKAKNEIKRLQNSAFKKT
jgi:predicted GIY-YIG superfamily endonuclease